MARHGYGGGISDWTFVHGDEVSVGPLTGRTAVVVGGVSVTFWNAPTGGVQYTDLLDADGAAVTAITSSDGLGQYALGQIPPFSGPDGVTQMWASANEGPRSLVTPTDLGGRVVTLEMDLDTHTAAINPHNTGLGNLNDVQIPAAAGRVNGHMLRWNNALQAFDLVAPPPPVEEITSGLTAATGFTVNTFLARRINGVCSVFIYMTVNTTVSATGGNVTDTLMCTLPSGWRPPGFVAAVYGNGSMDGEALVAPDGTVTLRSANASINPGSNVRLSATFVL